eukprot:scaffold45316_cov110-Skeletonema_marinoi.AAC.1
MNLQIAYIAAAALGRVSAFTPSTISTARQTIFRSASSSTTSTLNMSSEDTITLGIFGGGTVGGGIVEILSNKADYFKQLTGKSIEVKKVCVRDASKPRDFTLPEGCSI